MESSERTLVPLRSELASPPSTRDGANDVSRLLAAAFGLAVEGQRRALGAATAVTAQLGSPCELWLVPRWRWHGGR